MVLRHTSPCVCSVLTIKMVVTSIMLFTCYKVLALHMEQSSYGSKEWEIPYLFPLLDSSILINYCSCSVWPQYMLIGPLKSIKLFKAKEYLTTNLFPGQGPGIVLKHGSCVNIVIKACPHSAVKFKQTYILFLTGPVPTSKCASYKSFVTYGKTHTSQLWLTLDTSLRLCRDLSDLQLMDRGNCLLGVIQSSCSELLKCNATLNWCDLTHPVQGHLTSNKTKTQENCLRRWAGETALWELWSFMVKI